MGLIAWKDHNDTPIIESGGTDIIFKYTFAQLNARFVFNAPLTVMTPIKADLNAGFSFTPELVVKTFISSKLISGWGFVPEAINRINKWETIMVRYIGDRT